MTDDEINKAIAETLGRKHHKPTDTEVKSGSYYQYEPAYTEDLNAMHEVEETMDGDIEDANSPRYIYAGWLYRIVPKEHQPIRATARQRAEAYLRTLGKWKE